MTDFGNNVSTFAYDNVNRHIATMRQDGFRSHYQYDASGRLKRLRHHDGSTTLADFLYEVDARGNRTKATELLRTSGASMTTTVIAHDDTDIEYGGTWSAVSGFQETTQIGATLRFEFLGNTDVELTMGEGDDHSIYDVYVNETLWQSYDGYASVSGERVIDIPLTNDGVNVLEVRNTMDVNSGSSGRKVRFKQLSVDSDLALNTIDYTYDGVQRLLSANYDGGAVEYSYGYDLAGNLVNKNGITRTFNSANQMTNDGTNTLTYDNNGNLTSDGTNTHTWDRANRLLSVGTHSYAYDGNGARIQKTVSSVVTDYLLDVQPGLTQVLAETTGANTNHYIHSPRGIHVMNNGSNWSYMLQDGLGSVRAEIGANVAVNGSQSYAPYGEVFGASGVMSSPFAFTGEPLDGNGLQYHRARYYSPEMGVWVNQDFLETSNRYSYVRGRVVNRVDKTGLFDESTCTVEAGDYLEGIGVQVGVKLSNGNYVPGYGRATNAQLAEVRQLMRAWNPHRPHNIYPGDRLSLPPNAKGISCGLRDQPPTGSGVIKPVDDCGVPRYPTIDQSRQPINDQPPLGSGFYYPPHPCDGVPPKERESCLRKYNLLLPSDYPNRTVRGPAITPRLRCLEIRDFAVSIRTTNLAGYRLSSVSYTDVDALVRIIEYAVAFGQSTQQTVDDLSCAMLEARGAQTIVTALPGTNVLRSNTTWDRFADTGFHPDYQDGQNQINHFWAYLNSAAQGDVNIGRIGNTVHEQMGIPDIRTGATIQDERLAYLGLALGKAIHDGLIPPQSLASEIRRFLESPYPVEDPSNPDTWIANIFCPECEFDASKWNN